LVRIKRHTEGIGKSKTGLSKVKAVENNVMILFGPNGASSFGPMAHLLLAQSTIFFWPNGAPSESIIRLGHTATDIYEAKKYRRMLGRK
jgi:hypothetical protein